MHIKSLLIVSGLLLLPFSASQANVSKTCRSRKERQLQKKLQSRCILPTIFMPLKTSPLVQVEAETKKLFSSFAA